MLGGHSAAAGHGNQFQQNKQITFHHLMEPVFDKLGVRLVSRNMGQGGVGTLQFSIGGKDLYGEADIMEWDSAMTEKGNTVDLWNKQAILSGERVPVILSPFHFNVMDGHFTEKFSTRIHVSHTPALATLAAARGPA